MNCWTGPVAIFPWPQGANQRLLLVGSFVIEQSKVSIAGVLVVEEWDSTCRKGDAVKNVGPKRSRDRSVFLFLGEAEARKEKLKPKGTGR